MDTSPRHFLQPPSFTILEESARWQARDVEYVAGSWKDIKKRIPSFALHDYRVAPEEPSNPYLKNVVRKPLTPTERPIPVGIVSNTYTLAQHHEVIDKCLEAFAEVKIEVGSLRCELGLTPLGEWMNFRMYFPEKYAYTPTDGKALGLRLECFNSVDGSSQLMVVLGWLRLVCLNGLIIGKTLCELKDIHNRHLDLVKITEVVTKGLGKVDQDKLRMADWEKRKLMEPDFKAWIDYKLAEKWGKKAATRVFHICSSGHDVELTDPFEKAQPSEKTIKKIEKVPGAPIPASNLYDLSQALSWIASRRSNPEDRMDWQRQIPELINSVAKTKAT